MSYIIQKENLTTGVIVFLLGLVGASADSWSSQRHKAQRFAREDDAKQVIENLRTGDNERVSIEIVTNDT